MINKDTYKRLTSNNVEEYDPEYDFCIGCRYFGYYGCNVPNGACSNYKHFMKTYNRLADLEDKIENGTLVEPTCKVGDKVYQLDNAGDIYESEIKCLIYVTSHIAFDERSIRTSIFLTKEQAEARLKELKGE